MEILWKILATLGLVVLNGFFVAAEFAAVGARASRLEVAAQTSLLARLCLNIKKRLDLYLSTCQVGITIASLGLGAVTEPLVAGMVDPVLQFLGFQVPGPMHHSATAITIALAISTSLHVVVGEQAPKNWAIMFADRVLPLVAIPLVIFTYLFYPVIWALNWVSNAVLRLTGVKTTHDVHGGLPHTEDELKALLAQAVTQGTIPKGHQKILTSAFEFNELKVRQIMTPRVQVDFLRTEQPMGDILHTVQKSAYTRLPLCDGDLDHVVGLVHMKDLFNHLQLSPGKLKFIDERDPDGTPIAIPTGLPGSAVHVIGSGDIDLRKIRRDILFVPELLPVPKLLRQFQNSRTHMAVVVDEYGSTQGIITLEDVIEEIVGEIEDEFDTTPSADFLAEGENFRVKGHYPLHELKDKLALIDMEFTDVDTIGGYLIQQLGRWPKAGDSVPLGPYLARVISVQQNRVGHVLISPATQQAAKADGPGVA